MPNRDRPASLKPLVFHVLLVLLDGERHGYAIVKELEERIEGAHFEPGNLYRTLRTMVAKSLIEESERRPDPELDDQRRRYFRITDTGIEASRAEVARLENMVALARSHKVLAP